MSEVVETRCGRIRGVAGSGCWSFRGIPFAKPPVGELRFRAPEPPDPWGGVRDVTELGAGAPQRITAIAATLGFGAERVSEDCLSLNVFTPATDGGRRPVLFWLHGGIFVLGAGSNPLYDGAALARRGDVVVVTTNYRLGALGFLDLREHIDCEPNAGTLDQLAALEWTCEHIGAFGGDPENITLFGESAGAMSIATLMAAPRARGLFRRAILQSGAASNVSSPAAASRTAAAYLEDLGADGTRSSELRELPLERLLDAQDRRFTAHPDEGSDAGLAFQPCVDGALIPQQPLKAIDEGRAACVPVLFGTTVDEVKLFARRDPLLDALDEAGVAERLARALLRVGAPDCSHAGVALYRDARRGKLPTDPKELWLAIETDRVFRHPARRLADALIAQGAELYSYLFAYRSPAARETLGACHALELAFVFGTYETAPGIENFVGRGPDVARLSNRIQDAWIEFARSGSPGHAELPAWPRYEREQRLTMRLAEDCGVEVNPFDEELCFWDEALTSGVASTRTPDAEIDPPS